MSIAKHMTIQKYKKLVSILGESDTYKLNRLEISVNTERRDENLLSDMARIVKQAEKVAQVLGVSIDDLKMSQDWEQSDHEIVTHYVELNPTIEVGGYAYFKSDLCEIVSEENGVYTIKPVNGTNVMVASGDYLHETHWGEIFLVRDQEEPENIYY